jgi:rhodanese-related sulfurtransferase
MKWGLTIILLCGLTIPVLLFAEERVLSQDDEELRQLEITYNDHLMMPETLLQRIVEGKDGYVLFDLRLPRSFQQSHLVNAINLPWRTGRFREAVPTISTGKDIILIDTDGTVGLLAIDLLYRRGIRNCFVIEGGMDNWLYAKYLE